MPLVDERRCDGATAAARKTLHPVGKRLPVRRKERARTLAILHANTSPTGLRGYPPRRWVRHPPRHAVFHRSRPGPHPIRPPSAQHRDTAVNVFLLGCALVYHWYSSQHNRRHVFAVYFFFAEMSSQFECRMILCSHLSFVSWNCKTAFQKDSAWTGG